MPNSNYHVFAKNLGDPAAPSHRTLLLLHGFPESSFYYHKVVDGLREHFDRVVLFDMLGYGFNDKPEQDYSYSLIEQADVALHVWRALGSAGSETLRTKPVVAIASTCRPKHSGPLLLGRCRSSCQN